MEKSEKKTKAVFILTMPRVNTWNGTWTGANNIYAHALTHIKYGKKLFPKLEEKSYGYDFGDALVRTVGTDGRLGTDSVYYAGGVRPVINLKSGSLTTGSGTASNPYEVE